MVFFDVVALSFNLEDDFNQVKKVQIYEKKPQFFCPELVRACLNFIPKFKQALSIMRYFNFDIYCFFKTAISFSLLRRVLLKATCLLNCFSVYIFF